MSQTNEQALAVLDKAAEEGCALARSAQKSFSAVLQIARVANTIRSALSPALVQELIMPLRNTDFGWRQDNGSYTLEQIRDCFVAATLQGAFPINNEVNIISARHYLTLNYFKRAVGNFPGLTDLAYTPGKIVSSPGGATVEMTVVWKMNGKDQSLARVGTSAIPVRLNAGMGADGAIGKATRKVLKAVYERLTGSASFHDGDVDDASGDQDVVISARIVPDSEVEKKPVQSKTASVAAAIKKPAPTQNASIQAAEVPEAADNPWDSPATDLDQELESQPETVDAAVDEVVKTIQAKAEVAAPAAPPTPAAPAKKKKGGFVRDGGSGEFKRLDATATEAPKETAAAAAGPKVVVPSVSADQPAQNEQSGADGELGEAGDAESAVETTQDVFVGRVVAMKDPVDQKKVLYYKAAIKNSTDIFATLDVKTALSIKDEWIPKGANGEMATITWVAENVSGVDVCMIKSIS